MGTSYLRSGLSLRLFSTGIFCTVLLSSSLAIAKPMCLKVQKSVKSLSTDELTSELEGIRESRAEIKMYTEIGDKIQLKPPCSTHWQNKKKAFEEYKRADKNLMTPQWVNRQLQKEELNKLKAKSAAHGEKYRLCFTEQLRKYPKLYNHDLVPARTIDEFEANYKQMNKRFKECEYAYRYAEAKNELKRREVN